MVQNFKNFVIFAVLLVALVGLSIFIDHSRLNTFEQSSKSSDQIIIQEDPADSSSAESEEMPSYTSSFFCEFSSAFKQTSLCNSLQGQMEFISRANKGEVSITAPEESRDCPTCIANEILIVENNDQVNDPVEEILAPVDVSKILTTEITPDPPEIVEPKAKPIKVQQTRAQLGRGSTAGEPQMPVPPFTSTPPPASSGGNREALGGRGNTTASPTIPDAPTLPVTPEQNIAVEPARSRVSPPTPPSPTSTSFETCDNKNNYLEKQFDHLAKERTFLRTLNQKNPGFKEHIKTACFKNSMETVFGPKSEIYGQCAPGQDSITTQNTNCRTQVTTVRGKKERKRVCSSRMDSANRPCLSERYVNTVKNSFDLATECLKDYLTPKDKFQNVSDQTFKGIQQRNALAVFSLLTVESGMHINAMSPTGAGGLGQLTGDGLSAVARIQIPQMKAFLTRPESSVQCKNLSRVYLQPSVLPRVSYSYNCDRISLTRGQPLVGLIYSYGHIKQSEEDMLRFLNNSDRRQMKKFNLNESEMDKLITALALWSHNTGSMGLIHPMTYLLNNKYSKRKVTNVDQFLAELKVYMKSHSFSRRRSRIIETSSYYSKIEKAQQNAGPECLAY